MVMRLMMTQHNHNSETVVSVTNFKLKSVPKISKISKNKTDLLRLAQKTVDHSKIRVPKHEWQKMGKSVF